jgi:hypothetical protein
MNLLILINNFNRASFKQRIAVYLDTLRRNGIDYEVAQLPSGTLARRKCLSEQQISTVFSSIGQKLI